MGSHYQPHRDVEVKVHDRVMMSEKDHQMNESCGKRGGRRFALHTNVWICFCVVLMVTIVCPDVYYFGSNETLPEVDYDDYVDIKHALMLPYPINAEVVEQNDALCAGKRVYMYQLPLLFNTGVSERCGNALIPWMDLCSRFSNSGFGQRVEGGWPGWYNTDPYLMDVIYHSRMRTYPCRTYEVSQADAFFIPWYGGLDALNWLYNQKATLAKRGRHGSDVLTWLDKHGGETWRKHSGRDHFLILGRTAWDFYLEEDTLGRWGTGFFGQGNAKNLTALMFESRSPKDLPFERPVPYPTSFHPSSPDELHRWINHAKNTKREFLMGFVGAPRPHIDTSIRGLIGTQCKEAGRKTCILVDCSKVSCSHDPLTVAKALLRSTFCMQPKGDTATRRSAFDCMIAGAIPVFFHEDSFYTQYGWHLPDDHESYSVFISEDDIRNGTSLKKVLSSYSPTRIRQMRKKVLSLIPRLVYNNYANPPDGETHDAFELSIMGVLQRVADYKQTL